MTIVSIAKQKRLETCKHEGLSSSPKQDSPLFLRPGLVYCRCIQSIVAELRESRQSDCLRGIRDFHIVVNFLSCNDECIPDSSQNDEGIVTKCLYYESRGTLHYNVHFKKKNVINRLIARDICGLRPVDIDWIWIVELRRRATTAEIGKLCKLAYEI